SVNVSGPRIGAGFVSLQRQRLRSTFGRPSSEIFQQPVREGLAIEMVFAGCTELELCQLEVGTLEAHGIGCTVAHIHLDGVTLVEQLAGRLAGARPMRVFGCGSEP
ncbi:hypothetical protein QTH97_25530, partial [Variovorax sp. J22R24]|uniref:hypothetical protein n=1 Tax=Variovorax gracilis TaxID=3053502 RepID=UPI002576A5CD